VLAADTALTRLQRDQAAAALERPQRRVAHNVHDQAAAQLELRRDFVQIDSSNCAFGEWHRSRSSFR